MVFLKVLSWASILLGLYLRPLGQLKSNFKDISYHCAKDIQLYLLLIPLKNIYSFKLYQLYKNQIAVFCLITDKTEVFISSVGGLVPTGMECFSLSWCFDFLLILFYLPPVLAVSMTLMSVALSLMFHSWSVILFFSSYTVTSVSAI